MLVKGATYCHLTANKTTDYYTDNIVLTYTNIQSVEWVWMSFAAFTCITYILVMHKSVTVCGVLHKGALFTTDQNANWREYLSINMGLMKVRHKLEKIVTQVMGWSSNMEDKADNLEWIIYGVFN